jgi:hypothetical protein
MRPLALGRTAAISFRRVKKPAPYAAELATKTYRNLVARGTRVGRLEEIADRTADFMITSKLCSTDDRTTVRTAALVALEKAAGCPGGQLDVFRSLPD